MKKIKFGILELVYTTDVSKKFYHVVIYDNNNKIIDLVLLSDHSLVQLINMGYEVNIVEVVTLNLDLCVAETAKCQVYMDKYLRSNPDEEILNNLNTVPVSSLNGHTLYTMKDVIQQIKIVNKYLLQYA